MAGKRTLVALLLLAVTAMLPVGCTKRASGTLVPNPRVPRAALTVTNHNPFPLRVQYNWQGDDFKNTRYDPARNNGAMITIADIGTVVGVVPARETRTFPNVVNAKANTVTLLFSRVGGGVLYTAAFNAKESRRADGWHVVMGPKGSERKPQAARR